MNRKTIAKLRKLNVSNKKDGFQSTGKLYDYQNNFLTLWQNSSEKMVDQARQPTLVDELKQLRWEIEPIISYRDLFPPNI